MNPVQSLLIKFMDGKYLSGHPLWAAHSCCLLDLEALRFQWKQSYVLNGAVILKVPFSYQFIPCGHYGCTQKSALFSKGPLLPLEPLEFLSFSAWLLPGTLGFSCKWPYGAAAWWAAKREQEWNTPTPTHPTKLKL